MDLKFNVKFLFVDVSLITLRCVIGAYAALYILHMRMDISTHGKLENPNWSKQFQSEALGIS
jgi:hypothetical protein